MSATNVEKTEEMFHIQHPQKRDFWSWTELGCLARALGFPTDLIRHNVNEEVEVEEKGMYLQQLSRMMELKLLNQALHRSFNMHTSDWNLCAIRKAVQLLNLSVLSFEELHNIRVAYATYEAVDMKGLVVDQRTLLRTLKMCHRVISPKKLMHRVKHMKPRLEEPNRIQLYEFFDLIMWCDNSERHQGAHTVGLMEGKEKDLYKLVEFESLLSHQDQRQSRALDQRYLAEEWEFGREQLGSKHMFKGEVVYTDQRIKQTRSQKKNYRGLKTAVSQSQRRVYRAHAGSIRQRPISAPDLSMYSTPRGTPRVRTTSAAAMYESVQRRLHSAASGRTSSRLHLSDRPILPEYVRAHTPSVVTSQDLDDVALKMQMLQFDIFTLETRCQVKKEEEMDFYIPEREPPVKEEDSDRAETQNEERAKHWSPDIIDNLAYPPYHRPPCHAQTCDARFRGWNPADHKGRQKILTAPTFDNSPHGQLLARQRSAMLAPVTNLHKDYVVRYTSSKEASEQRSAKRPCTAPPTSPRTKPVKRIGCRSAGHYSRRHDAEQPAASSRSDDDMMEENPRSDDSKDNGSARVVKTYPDPCGKHSQGLSKTSSLGNALETEEPCPRGSSAAPDQYYGSDASAKGGEANSGGKGERCQSSVACKNGSSRRPGGSKVVDVGLIGTITLLESIQEHETEDGLTTTTLSTTSSSRPPSPDQTLTSAHGLGHRQQTLDLSPKAVPPGWSRGPPSPAGYGNSAPGGGRQKLGGAVSASSRAEDNGVLREAAQGSASGTCRAGQVETGSQGPTKSGSQFTGGNKQNGDHSSKQAYDQSWAGSDLPLRPEHRQNTELRKPRVNSAASSAMSDVSDHREVPTPLTSFTVTLKNKNQHVTSTRVNDYVGEQADVTGGNVSSPLGFRRSSPFITSTPRRRRASPTTTTPKTKDGSAETSRKSSQASCRPNPSQQNAHLNTPVSAGKGLGKHALGRLQSDADHDPDGRLSWVQDQILAMNLASEEKQPENRIENEPGADAERPRHEDLPVEEGEGEEEEDQGEAKIKAIRFSKERTFQDQREAAHKQHVESRKASMAAALKLNSCDLNGERQRRFVFNKATTRRLLQRVEDISPKLRTRIRTGDMGLKVV